MGTLILNSLEIQGFRGFRQLQIERLGRVNLIVGKNNVGKSSLLEALQLYARRGSPTLIWKLLRDRDESTPFSRRPTSEIEERPIPEIEERLTELKYLFYGRKSIKAHHGSIQIGPVDTLEDTLSISVDWYAEQSDEEGHLTRRLLQPEEYDTVDTIVPRFTIQMGNERRVSYSLDVRGLSRLTRPEFNDVILLSVAADGLLEGRFGVLWDGIALTSLEKDVLTALRIIAPGVEALSIVKQGSNPIVKIKDIDEPLPLRSLGDGMQRTLGIALALVNAKDGILLIDEFENGLYYSVQPDLWRLIFSIAHRLNVQVFATTHSWDCIAGFQKASQEDNQEEGMLIRLESKKSGIVATLFDEQELGIATREQIEVR